MVDEQKTTLNDVKNEWFLNYSSNSSNIAKIFKIEYKKYVKSPTSYDGEKFDFGTLLNNCKGMQPQLIPYSALTEIIFKNDMTIQSIQDKEIGESNFAVIIENRFEQYLVKEYGIEQQPRSGNEEQVPFDAIEKELYQDKIEENKNEIIISYKIFEHLKLAISQKKVYTKNKQQKLKI
ncbi:hypothetical protein [Staphylococcus edaphicus]|uniref:Uncharacterized protein n=1 Tax=Staphylococcus edaphicus TaxID=1955013 RepID=A0ABY4QCD7_9STAP|nr:hypothetical protein [Staphylococcus edaphicus]UQW81390.1 hypothetical protein MNY58_12665 [Staphylococcus edaphicus]